jgi:ABC-2 type transport system permease protein
MTDLASTPTPSTTRAWAVVAGRELRDLWLSGFGLVLMLAHTGLLSVTTYLVASNQELNFLEQREAVNLTLRVAVVAGVLQVVLRAADAFSGERERGSLEALLLTPAPRRALVIGKGVAAVSLWVVAFLFSVPYVWWLGRDVGTFGVALVSGFIVGTLLALFLAGVGLLISIYSTSSGLSLSVGILVLLALYAPNQMPTNALRGWVGEMLLRIDPFTSGLLYLDRLILQGHSVSQDAGLLVGPLALAVALPLAAVSLAGRLSLMGRGRM